MELVNVNLYAEGYYSGATYEDNIWIKESSYEKLRDIFPTEISCGELDGKHSEVMGEVEIQNNWHTDEDFAKAGSNRRRIAVVRKMASTFMVVEEVYMKFEHTKVCNLDGAVRGLRNPMQSWDRSDSYQSDFTDDGKCGFVLGANDLELMQRLLKASIKEGSSHSKFMRQIMVCVDITAPLFWWKEADQYRVGVITNSESTMHKLASTPITMECFEIGDYNKGLISELVDGEQKFLFSSSEEPPCIIDWLESLRQAYLKTKDRRYWKELVRWLPESWLQTRTVTLNYENVRNMYFQRRHHKLTEWSEQFVAWVESLPYAKELIMYEGDTNE